MLAVRLEISSESLLRHRVVANSELHTDSSRTDSSETASRCTPSRLMSAAVAVINPMSRCIWAQNGDSESMNAQKRRRRLQIRPQSQRRHRVRRRLSLQRRTRPIHRRLHRLRRQALIQRPHHRQHRRVLPLRRPLITSTKSIYRFAARFAVEFRPRTPKNVSSS